jgi:hypothetical protein
MLTIPIRPFLDILEVNYPTSHKKVVFQRAAQFNSMLIKTRDAYLIKKDPALLMGRRASVRAASVLLQRVIKKVPIDHYTAVVRLI